LTYVILFSILFSELPNRLKGTIMGTTMQTMTAQPTIIANFSNDQLDVNLQPSQNPGAKIDTKMSISGMADTACFCIFRTNVACVI
jgi:hypothetical protein